MDYATAIAEAEKAKTAAIDAAKKELAELEVRRKELKAIVGRKPRERKPKKPVAVEKAGAA